MASPEALSGKYGYIEIGTCDVCGFQMWTVDRDNGIQTYNARCGNGWQLTIVGNKKFSGTISGVYDAEDEIEDHIETDNLVTLILHHDDQNYHYGSARIGKITYGANADTGEIQKWSAAFESHGPWTTQNG